MNRGLFFEDFQPGEHFQSAGRTLFEADISNFIGIAGIYEELYTNLEYIEKSSIFGRRFAPGPLTFSLSEGLAIQTGLFRGTGLALLEVKMQFLVPWFIGETISVDIEVVGKRQTSKPGRGIVEFRHTVTKAQGEKVLALEKIRMVRSRNGNDGGE